ncbi:MAG TPA: MBL fold metallo-hydrolase [Holophagaceae bacterium]|nr:MBL fold metallo-hydrolase [Holophagaceae bacterium]
MPAPRILRVPILPLGLVNAHLILGEEGTILVDTGLPGSEAKIERALRREGRSLRSLTLIVVTHAHVDHAGSAARLRERSGAPIVAHAGDLMYLRRERPMSFCPTGWFGRFFLRTRLMLQPYVGFTPDLLLGEGESLDLAPYGMEGEVRSTPGHTAGSISVALRSKDALVGDLLASGLLLGGIARIGHAKRPPFEDDPTRVGRELVRLLDAGAERFFMGHGGPLPAEEVRRHASHLNTLQSTQELP